MLAGSFRNDRPVGIIALLVLLGVLWTPSFLAPRAPLQVEAMPLMSLVLALTTSAAWVAPLLSLLFTLAIALLVDGMVNANELLDRRTHLPALLLPLLICTGPTGMLLGPAMVGMPFVLLALHRVFGMAGRPRVHARLFDAGLLLGLAGLCHLPYVFLLVVLWATVSVTRSFQWREYVIPTLGAAIILAMGTGVMVFLDMHRIPFLTVTRPKVPGMHAHPVFLALLLLLLALFAIAGMFAFSRSYKANNMRGKDLRSSFLAFLMAMVVVCALEKLLNDQIPSTLVATPLAVFFSYPLLRPQRPWLAELAVLALAALAVWAQWGASATFAA